MIKIRGTPAAKKISGFRKVFLFFILFLFGNIAYAQTEGDLNEEAIDAIFKKWDRDGSPGCVVGIFQDEEMAFSKGYGEADIKKHIPITPETVFYMGSISKQFTAAAIVLLHIRGKVDLKRPVKYYIPELSAYPEYNDPTIEELVHHTSGLPDLYSLLRLYDLKLSDGMSADELLKVIVGQSHLNFEPGSEYLYSNSGYTLLAEVVERVTGQSLRKFTSENIFDPLGMKHTHFHDNHNHEIDNQSLSYWGTKNFRLGYISNFEGVGPGGLYSTIGDMLKWDQQLTENRLSHAEGFNELMRQRGILNNGDTLTYAFALKIDRYKGQKAVGHSGSFMGFKTDYLRLPEWGYGSAVLCNLGSTNPSALNRKVADVVLQKVFSEWLGKYAGTYYSKDLKLTYILKVKDGNLYLIDQKRTPSGKLTYEDVDTFSTGSWTIEFMTRNGTVKGFEISTGRAKNIVFEKQ